ncbi:flavin reductase family protein [Sphingomonas abietis]|uniref:Flavin reductase family protein n=1 Tax=Sphingomonas abietis TaxID=3012344 RepID=A0ABY7NJM3_9SPHN|nr:flavin reductase family protein [Sphingomonas abietis]WBO21679.1 flavin reductase family protein [Sphingomonas abietis]
MIDMHFYEPAAGHRLPHDPFKAIVAPRPIGWISTVDGAGRPNLAPYSFFNAIADTPPMIAFCSSGRKDSLANCEATGEFTWNLATRHLAEAMNRSSAALPHGVSEYEVAGLVMAPSRLVATPRVDGSPAALECKVVDIHRLRDIGGTATDNWLVIGQVIGVHIDPACLDADGLYDTAKAGPILRAGYRGAYAELKPDAMFEMIRPR